LPDSTNAIANELHEKHSKTKQKKGTTSTFQENKYAAVHSGRHTANIAAATANRSFAPYAAPTVGQHTTPHTVHKSKR
jgi:hypothetical protein